MLHGKFASANQKHYPDLGSISMVIQHLFCRRQFAAKTSGRVAKLNVGGFLSLCTQQLENSVCNIQRIPTSWRMSSIDFSSQSDEKQQRSLQSWLTITAYSTTTPRRRSGRLRNRPKGARKDASFSSQSRPTMCDMPANN